MLQLHHPGDRDHAVDSEIMMEFVPNDRLFLVLEGRTEMHIATLKHSHNVVWSALIPGKHTTTLFYHPVCVVISDSR